MVVTHEPLSRPLPTPAPVAGRCRIGSATLNRRIREAARLAASSGWHDRLDDLAELARRACRSPRRVADFEAAVAACLDAAAEGRPPAERWLACEAACWAVAWLVRDRPAGGAAGELFERLVSEAAEARARLATGDTLPARFALVLSRLFSDVDACRHLESESLAAVVAEVGRLAAPSGFVSLADSGAALERVVRWTAFRDAAVATGKAAWDDEVEHRWRAAVTAAVPLLGSDGRLPGATGPSPRRFTATVLRAARRFGGRAGRTVAVLRGRRTARRRKVLPGGLHDPASAAAVLRSGWGLGSVRVMLHYRDATPRLELAIGDRLLIDGDWEWRVAVDGAAIEPDGPWAVSCWEAGRKAIFLEIAAPLPGGRQIERQVVVLPRDRVVLLADSVTLAPGLDASAATLQYRGRLRLAAGQVTEAAVETRDLVIGVGAGRCLALPLGLPEWRVAGRGTMAVEGDSLLLEQAGRVRLYAPLWLDCDPRRIGAPLTWRQLTVADTRRNLPPHQAAGFRVQSGVEQWLLYRSLDAARNRTLLGCNVSCDFLVGRVKRSGKVARTLEIQ